VQIRLKINNKIHELTTRPNRTLAQVLREDLGMTGTKMSCGEGECGSCTVLVDGAPVTSCLMLAGQATGRDIQTIEGVGSKDALDVIQQAFVEEQGFQCGACTPGFIMAAKSFLTENPTPTLDEASQAMSGNICRCGADPYIVRAVLNAAGKLAQQKGSAP
jgi:aerobic-type carbon monoxide dehydrogenase small subunit (CoxS/CutS family)